MENDTESVMTLEQMRSQLEKEREKNMDLQNKLNGEKQARLEAERKLLRIAASPIAVGSPSGRIKMASVASLSGDSPNSPLRPLSSGSSGGKLTIQERLFRAEIEKENAQSELSVMRVQLEQIMSNLDTNDPNHTTSTKRQQEYNDHSELQEEEMSESLMLKLQEMMHHKSASAQSRSSSVSGEFSANSSVVHNRDDDSSSIADSAVSIMAETRSELSISSHIATASDAASDIDSVHSYYKANLPRPPLTVGGELPAMVGENIILEESDTVFSVATSRRA